MRLLNNSYVCPRCYGRTWTLNIGGVIECPVCNGTGEISRERAVSWVMEGIDGFQYEVIDDYIEYLKACIVALEQDLAKNEMYIDILEASDYE